MGKILDACGLTCPAPVLLVKDALELSSESKLTILVDNEASLENVSRFLGSKGYTVKTYKEDNRYRIEGLCDEDSLPVTEEKKLQKTTTNSSHKILVMITTDCLGTGDDSLGKKLMTAYVKTLKEMGEELWQIILVNGGVRLAVETSTVLLELQELEKNGVIILACGTCLEHFKLSPLKKVGTTTNMLDIVMATQLADKVINIS